MNTLISLIIPVYNVEKYLHRCLDSIISQTYKKLEIILVNDGSLDNSGAICDEYVKKDTRIKVIHQKNKGLSSARNSGLKIASGDYIGFIDSDDWVHVNMYEILLTEILLNNSDLAICNFIESNKPREELDYERLKPEVLDKDKTLWNYLNHGFYVWRTLYSKKVFENFKFDEKIPFVEDIFFGANLINLINRSVFINLPLYIYNVDNITSLTRVNYNKNKFLSFYANIHVQNKIEEIFPNDTLLNDFIRKRILSNCLFHLQNLYTKGNENLDMDNDFKKKVKKAYNKNFVLDKNSSIVEVIIRLLNLSSLKHFYTIILNKGL